jgi:hypothetical protein
MNAELIIYLKNPQSYALTLVRKLYKIDMDIISQDKDSDGALVVLSGAKRMLKKLAHHPAGLYDSSLENMIEEV